MKKSVSMFEIDEIISGANTISECLLNLYKKVIDHPWEEIAQFNTWPQCSEKTTSYILDKMSEKFEQIDVNMIWLNKGFASVPDIKEWEFHIPEGCYTLVSQQVENLQEIVESFAKTEVEEYPEEPDLTSGNY